MSDNTISMAALFLTEGDVIEYVGTTHDYSTATVTDASELDRFTMKCSFGHSHTVQYRPRDTVRLVIA